jgi:hypothetical protein
MKMNTAQIRQTLHQYHAQALPAEHPLMPQLERLFGDHTYFLDGNGLNIVEPVIVEPVEPEQTDGVHGVVVNLASWVDEKAQSLQPHKPEPTDMVVDLEGETRH